MLYGVTARGHALAGIGFLVGIDLDGVANLRDEPAIVTALSESSRSLLEENRRDERTARNLSRIFQALFEVSSFSHHVETVKNEEIASLGRVVADQVAHESKDRLEHVGLENETHPIFPLLWIGCEFDA